MQHTVFIGLGANLHEPLQQLHTAALALSQIPDTQLVAMSSLYGSKPMGPQDQPDYVNAVAQLTTSLAPHQLLDALQHIEQQHGRTRKAERWGPRTLDLDILLFGEQILHDERLTVPHYGMHLREFVLYPLAEIAPELEVPVHGPLASLLAKVPLNGLTVLGRVAIHG
jgi:2-amino-4-hydroxy-6-hydroxymethyldihydropteridine diphosphokinase